MQLLNEIIDGAASADVRLAVLLRKSLVLASRLGNETLKDWCSAELDGYLESSSLPSYRSFPCQSLGLMIGPLGTINRQPIPLALLKKHHQEVVETVNITAGVAELEATIGSGDADRTLSSPWSPNMTMLYQEKIISGYSLNRAWREFPAAKLVGICDTVRNRLLRLALELREQVGESDDPLSEITPAQLESKVVNYIYGGQNVIGSTVGRDVAQATKASIAQGDFGGLVDFLKHQGIGEPEIEALPAAIAADEAEVAKGDIGLNVHDWIGKAVKGAADGAKAVGINTVTAAIRHYLGI